MKSTAQKLKKVTNAQNLFRHESGTYYGIKKVAGRKKFRSFETADRKTADGRLKAWLASLEVVNSANADITVGLLGQKFLAARASKAVATVTAERRMWKQFQATFPRPMDTLVTRVVHSDIAAWLAKIKPGKRHSTYNRWRLFVRELFEVAEADGAVIKSPFVDRLNPTAKKQKVVRAIPTEEEFVAIIEEIRQPTWKHVTGKAGGQRPKRQDESADFAEFLGRAGVGQAEAATLKWEDICDREMTFTRRKTGKHFSVLITADVRPVLHRRREKAGGANATGRVFTVLSVKTALNSALKRLNSRHFSQRNFRSFKIVRMLDAGLDVKFVALQQGHQDGGKLILDTYSDVVRKNQQEYEDAQLARMEGKLGMLKVLSTSAPSMSRHPHRE